VPGPELLRAILEAWWEAEHCDPPGRAEPWERLEQLLAKASEQSGVSRQTILRAVHHRYRAYAAARLKRAARTGRPE